MAYHIDNICRQIEYHADLARLATNDPQPGETVSYDMTKRILFAIEDLKVVLDRCCKQEYVDEITRVLQRSKTIASVL